jgi:hypothetical protein
VPLDLPPNAAGQLSGTQLFGRSCRLVIGYPNSPDAAVDVAFSKANSSGIDISGIDFDFTVEKSLKPTAPNTCSLKIYNLSDISRQKISGAGRLTVLLEAGYYGATSQLYFAETRAGWSTRDGADFVTHIESQDSVAKPTGVRKTKKLQPGAKSGNLNLTLGAKVPMQQAFQTIADTMGVGLNVQQLNQALGFGTLVSSVNGAALVGSAAQRMTDLCRSAGCEWSIQDGVLQVLNIGKVLSTFKAIEISDKTGMIDSPSVDSQGAVTVSTLLIPGLLPGVLVNIDSLFVNGGYRVEKCRYHGSTTGGDWTCHFDAVAY